MAEQYTVYLKDEKYLCAENTLISEFLHQHDLMISLPCGGNGKCGKCKVFAEGELTPLSAAERKLLSEEEIAAGMRLACETRIKGECRIAITSESAANVAVDGLGEKAIEFPRYKEYGIAIDIGTTTIAMKLFDRNGLIGSETGLNPQERFGADVITRISKSLEGAAAEIKSCTVAGLGRMIESLCTRNGVAPSAVDHLVITGNTAMLYLLTASDPDALSHLPFEADHLFGEYIRAGELNLPLPEDTPVYLTRCLAAFVGGDISSAIYSSGLVDQPDTAVLVDVGTNGEMALWHDHRLICCSTAAGPAFEGAEIAMGMHGAPGAIDKLWVEDDDIAFSVIGNISPVGICGSGIVDAISVMLKLGYIDENGALEKDTLAEAGRLLTVNDKPACRICDSVYVTQRDVRMVQLAKSAICSGIETMLLKAGVSANDVSRLYLAGGFGNYLDLNNAAYIGLIPPVLAAKTVVIGNAALQGAVYTLVDSRCSEKELLENIDLKVLDLGADPDFMDSYVDNMCFE